MEITTQYYVTPRVDKNKMLTEARDRQKKGEGSIVHDHAYNGECNEKCVEFR